MRIKKVTFIYPLLLCWMAAIFVGCIPSSTEVNTIEAGCSDGGPGVFTPEDVSCYLAYGEPNQVQRFDQEMVMLMKEPGDVIEWAGAAIIYHIPTNSMLVLDQFGDADPQASIFRSRAGFAALSKLAGNAELMAGLKQQLLLKWQTAPSNEPEIRLGTAWQDGPTTVFFIAVAGLEVTDDRFYCPSQTWTIGDTTEEIAYECMAHEAGTPISHLFFEIKTIKGINERPVQVALNGVPSDIVLVREGPVAQETVVYQAVLRQMTNRSLLVRSETAPGIESSEKLATLVTMDLLQNYEQVNEIPFSLFTLFYNSNAYGVHPGEAIERDFLSGIWEQPDCESFRSNYPQLGGVVTLSRIGYSDDGKEALVHALFECGAEDRTAAYYTLAAVGDQWQVTNTFTAAAELPALMPELDYESRAKGCGDIFVYKSNRTGTENIYVSIEARTLNLTTAPLTFDLAADPETIKVMIEIYKERPEQDPYCNDVDPTADPQSVWKAVSGIVTIMSSAVPQKEPCSGEPYQATVLIEDIVFTLGNEIVLLPSLSFDDVLVGWCAG